MNALLRLQEFGHIVLGETSRSFRPFYNFLFLSSSKTLETALTHHEIA